MNVCILLLLRIHNKETKDDANEHTEAEGDKDVLKWHVEEHKASKECADKHGEWAGDTEEADDIGVMTGGVFKEVAFGRCLHKACADAREEHGDHPRDDCGCCNERNPASGDRHNEETNPHHFFFSDKICHASDRVLEEYVREESHKKN